MGTFIFNVHGEERRTYEVPRGTGVATSFAGAILYECDKLEEQVGRIIAKDASKVNEPALKALMDRVVELSAGYKSALNAMRMSKDVDLTFEDMCRGLDEVCSYSRYLVRLLIAVETGGFYAFGS